MKKRRGGYDVPMAGRPDSVVHRLPLPEQISIPLQTPRVRFTQVRVSAGRRVGLGEVLATAPDTFGLPLLSPCPGTVADEAAPGHLAIVPENKDKFDIEPTPDGREDRRRTIDSLIRLGAWLYLREARTGAVPDPAVAPQAVIVTTAVREPFLPRGSTFLRTEFEAFIDGLECIQSLLEYQPIHLIVPEVRSELADRVLAAARGRSYVRTLLVPLRYPFGDPALAAQELELSDDAPVWALDVAGVLAWRRAVVDGLPCVRRTVTVGGPAAGRPAYFDVPVGYPLDRLFEAAEARGPFRTVRGGALRGQAVEETVGVDAEAQGYTLIPRPPEKREMLSFLRPGLDRGSYSRCWLSALRKPRPEPLTTASRGERRACVSCCLCEQVCPVGVFPQLIHRALYEDALEEAERLRIDLCIDCGLCSYVCPSKIDLRREFAEARVRIEEELHAEVEETE